MAGPFSHVIDPGTAKMTPSISYWDGGDAQRRYVSLLNKGLYKYADLLGVRFDPEHHRYYFEARKLGEKRQVTYRPLNVSSAKRLVVWQPKRRSTGESKSYWFRLGAGLEFHRVAGGQWCLSIRPERHITSDGVTPIESKQIGPKVTRLKAKMYNDKYLAELNFWRDFLCRGKPRIIFQFGAQVLVVEATFLDFSIDWLGIPGDDKPYKNKSYTEDLFSLAQYRAAVGGEFLDWDSDEEGVAAKDHDDVA